MSYVRKTKDVWCIYTNYGYGWECESEYSKDDYENPRKACYEDAKEYRMIAGVSVMIKKRREKI